VLNNLGRKIQSAESLVHGPGMRTLVHDPPLALAHLLIQPPGARRVCGAATSDHWFVRSPSLSFWAFAALAPTVGWWK
jgi:hypothetical protein